MKSKKIKVANATKPAQPVKPYKIESGIKIPEIVAKQGVKISPAAVTLGMLKVGESFVVKDFMEAIKASKSMRDFLTRERKNGGTRKFVSRQVKNGTRFWRTV